jgi:hypothetical protein
MVLALVICGLVLAYALGTWFYAMHVGAKRAKHALELSVTSVPPSVPVPAEVPSLAEVGVPSGVLYVPGFSEKIPKDNRYISDDESVAVDEPVCAA